MLVLLWHNATFYNVEASNGFDQQKNKMNENEPRVPAGQPGGGEWTGGQTKYFVTNMNVQVYRRLVQQGVPQEQIEQKASMGQGPKFNTKAEAETYGKMVEQRDPSRKTFVASYVDSGKQPVEDRRGGGTMSYRGNVK